MIDMVVLVPSRSRPQNVEPIVEAWHRTGAFKVADLCFILDDDDMQLDRYANELSVEPQVQRVIYPEWQPMVPKLNRMAVQAAKDYRVVAFMGDDHIPRTPAWADQLWEVGRLKVPSIAYGQDGMRDEKLATWWSMSSDIIKKLGRMVPAPVQHLYCDNAVMELGRAADCLVYLDTVLIEHMHPLANKAKMDAQYERVNRAQQYDRDAAAFHAWVKDGLEADATLLR